jgi:drug/metabolite transporter (DMT)-like permease
MQFLVAMMAAPILVAAAGLFALSGVPQFQISVPPASVVVKCLAIACTATVAHLLIYMAVARASAALVAPMTYVQLLVAAALGWLLFGTAPDLSTVAGAALIIGGGLLLWRSQKPKEVPEMPD